MFSLGSIFKDNEKELTLVGYHSVYEDCGHFKDENSDPHVFYFDDLTPGNNNDKNSSDSKRKKN